MLKLKLQYFGHLMRTDSLEKTLMLGKIEGRRRRGRQRMRWLDGSTNLWTRVWASSRSWWWIGKPAVLQSMGSQRVRHDWVTEHQEIQLCYPHDLSWWKQFIISRKWFFISCFDRKISENTDLTSNEDYIKFSLFSRTQCHNYAHTMVNFRVGRCLS